jgi:hypothetical protein
LRNDVGENTRSFQDVTKKIIHIEVRWDRFHLENQNDILFYFERRKQNLRGFLGSRSYMQHYARIPFCSALPFEKGRTPVLSATPWITDSTTVQNIVIIAIVS